MKTTGNEGDTPLSMKAYTLLMNMRDLGTTFRYYPDIDRLTQEQQELVRASLVDPKTRTLRPPIYVIGRKGLEYLDSNPSSVSRD